MTGIPAGQWDLISFDVFDTLLVRESVHPQSGAFFAKKHERQRTPIWWRFGVEHALRISSGVLHKVRETNFKQISTLVPQRFLDAEKEAELSILRSRPLGLELLDQAAKSGAQIIYISDTCFTSHEVKQFLENAGVPVLGKVFVSNEARATKREGKIYQHVQNEFGVDPSKWLHIGDDPLADEKAANRFGITTVNVQKRVARLDNLLHKRHIDFLNKSRDIDSLLTFGVFAAHVESNPQLMNDHYYRLGFTTIGPLVSGFSQWINSQLEPNEKITFLGRDGYLPEIVFDLFNESMNQRNYIQVSRRKLLFPAWIGLRRSPSEFLKRIPQLKDESSTNYQIRLGIIPDSSLPNLDNPDSNLLDELLSEEIHSLALEECTQLAKLVSKIESSSYLVDVGWRATLQEALGILGSRPVGGLYLGTSATTFIKKPEALGWLTNSGYPRRHAKVLRQSIGLIERSFSEQVPSDLGENANQIGFTNDAKISAIQDGAIAFAKVWADVSKKHGVTLSDKVALAGLKAVMLSPAESDLTVIGAIGNQHSPSISIDHNETLIPNIPEGVLALNQVPTAAYCGANWPLGYEKAVLSALRKNGVTVNRFQIFFWRTRGTLSSLKSYGLKNLFLLAKRRFS